MHLYFSLANRWPGNVQSWQKNVATNCSKHPNWDAYSKCAVCISKECSRMCPAEQGTVSNRSYNSSDCIQTLVFNLLLCWFLSVIHNLWGCGDWDCRSCSLQSKSVFDKLGITLKNQLQKRPLDNYVINELIRYILFFPNRSCWGVRHLALFLSLSRVAHVQ